MKEKQKLTARVGAYFGGMGANDFVLLSGNRRAVVRGCRKILSYAPGEICLLQNGRVVCLRGERLVCVSFSAAGVTIEGEIAGVLFQPGAPEVKK